MLKNWFKYLVVFLFCISIFFITSSPDSSGQRTRDIIAVMTDLSKSQVTMISFILRKSAHFLVFGILVLLVWWAIKDRPKSYFYAWLFATLYGATDEWHQVYVWGRTPRIRDVIIDSTGAIVFLLIIYFFQQKRNN